MKFTHLKAPLNKYTFKNKKIRGWVESRCEGLTLNLFAGKTILDSIKEIRVDIRDNMPAHHHEDALMFVNRAIMGYDTILLDPPYSYRKSMEKYEGAIVSPFKQLKDALPRILMPSGIIITFGYHSVSMGGGRGFEVEEICIVSHGGAIHDTIATVERSKP